MKHIPRFFVDNKLEKSSSIKLSAEQIVHAHTVMRLSKGDKILVFNEIDGEWECVISDSKKGIAVCCELVRNRKKSTGISLAFSLLTPNKTSIILEKCTELGVSEFFPVISQYTQYKSINIKKAEKIMIHACEQSMRLDVPKLHDIQYLNSFLEKESRSIIIGDERLSSPKLSNIDTSNSVILIGPEGGFSPKEFDMFKKYKNINLFSFGENILRSETAAIAFVSVCSQ